MKSIHRNIKRLQITLVTALVLAVSPTFATTITVLDENFDDVTGLSSPASKRNIADILASNPGQLPLGTTWMAPAANVNIRRGDNTINTFTGTSGFDSFFQPATSANRFLVLGDTSGNIGEAPKAGTMRIIFPFSIPDATTSLTISYRFAFDGVDTAVSADDTFSVILTDGGDQIIQSLASSGGFSSGVFSGTYLRSTFLDPDATDFWLEFRLFEHSNTSTNTAVGIDDIVVTAQAPEPSSLLLLGSGLISFGILARRYRKKG